MLLFTFLIDGLLPLCPLQVVSSPRAGLSLPPQCLTHERGAAKFIEQTSETKCFSPPEGTPNEAVHGVTKSQTQLSGKKTIILSNYNT